MIKGMFLQIYGVHPFLKLYMKTNNEILMIFNCFLFDRNFLSNKRALRAGLHCGAIKGKDPGLQDPSF